MSSPSVSTIQHLLGGHVAEGTIVRVQGWVRTRRDSKAGMSFIHVSDGSCFSPIQLVADQSLSNYDSEVVRLTTGCAIDAVGELVMSQGKGQSVEIKPSSVTVVGWVDDPETYPMQPKRHSMEHLR